MKSKEKWEYNSVNIFNINKEITGVETQMMIPISGMDFLTFESGRLKRKREIEYGYSYISRNLPRVINDINIV